MLSNLSLIIIIIIIILILIIIIIIITIIIIVSASHPLLAARVLTCEGCSSTGSNVFLVRYLGFESPEFKKLEIFRPFFHNLCAKIIDMCCFANHRLIAYMAAKRIFYCLCAN